MPKRLYIETVGCQMNMLDSELVVASLRREGYEILTAETAEEALRILDERSVDAILSDNKMPVMTGSEFLREAARRFPNAVRMIISGWAEEIPPSQRVSLGVCAMGSSPVGES